MHPPILCTAIAAIAAIEITAPKDALRSILRITKRREKPPL